MKSLTNYIDEKLVINKNYKNVNSIEDFISSEKLVYIKLSKLTSTMFPRLIIDIKKIIHVNDYDINDTEITISYGDGIVYADTFYNYTFSLQKNNLSLLRYNHNRHNKWLSSITLFINPSVNDKVKSMIKIIYNNVNNEVECKDALIDFIKYVVEDDNDQNTIIDFIGKKIINSDIRDKYQYDRLMSNI